MRGHMWLQLMEAIPYALNKIIAHRLVYGHTGNGKGLEGFMHTLRQTVRCRIEIPMLEYEHETWTRPGFLQLWLRFLRKYYEMRDETQFLIRF